MKSIFYFTKKNLYVFSRNGFRFFGANGDKDGSGSRTRNFAGYYGPLFRNFRFYGGSPTEELTRQLLREKRLEEFSNPAKGDATKEDPKAEDFVDDDEFWRQSLAEATLNSVLEKMVRRSSYSVLSLCTF